MSPDIDLRRSSKFLTSPYLYFDLNLLLAFKSIISKLIFFLVKREHKFVPKKPDPPIIVIFLKIFLPFYNIILKIFWVITEETDTY